jgi:hypothetical protein
MKKVAFSSRESSKARDEAIDRAGANASEEWKAHAHAAVLFVAKRRPKFTTDAIWFVLRGKGIDPPHEPRALGAIMLWAVAEGLCVSLWKYKRSVRVACHRRPVVTYKSLVLLPIKKRPHNKRMPL